MQRYGWYALIGLLIAIGGLFGMRQAQEVPQATGKLAVVASANFWGNLASQIGGNKVSVISLITDPEADPHLYESSAANAAAVTSASIVILNGLGYDDFAQRILDTNQPGSQTVVRASDVFDGHDGSTNPHLWYDIPKIPDMIAAIQKAFIVADPANAATYTSNADSVRTSLKPLMDELDVIKREHPHAPVAYTEPVAAYLLAAAGLESKTPDGFGRAVEEGEEPTPADQQAMNDLLSARAVHVLLYNKQAVTPATESLIARAEQAGVPVVPITETLPNTELTYQSWQLHQLQALRSALAK